MVGTMGKPVTRSRAMVEEPADMRTVFQHHGAAKQERHQHLIQTMVERQGQRGRMMSSGSLRKYVVIERAAVTMLRCVSITPFGCPVEPEV